MQGQYASGPSKNGWSQNFLRGLRARVFKAPEFRVIAGALASASARAAELIGETLTWYRVKRLGLEEDLPEDPREVVWKARHPRVVLWVRQQPPTPDWFWLVEDAATGTTLETRFAFGTFDEAVASLDEWTARAGLLGRGKGQ